ncbi:MAG: DUF4920 domain-containing protein [Deltaproteobacteria bacterium]|nr:DUF4920 domain-containing protein [Deltaproteobacteria bacterium]
MRIAAHLGFAFVALLIATACNQPAGPAPAPTTSSSGASLAPASSAATFGAPITSKDTVLLADLSRDPSRWQGQTIVLSGTVADVCPNMGCWMVIEDGGQRSRVRMHGHAFFVPRDSKGKKARVQGQVTASGAAAMPHDCKHDKQEGDHKECEKDKQGEIPFDATGVELM